MGTKTTQEGEDVGKGGGWSNQLIDNTVSWFVLFRWHHARGKLFTSEDRSYRIRGSPPGHGPAVKNKINKNRILDKANCEIIWSWTLIEVFGVVLQGTAQQ